MKKGRVRFYLKHPGEHKFVTDERGKNDLIDVPNEDFICAEATPEQPVTLQGRLLPSKYSKYDVLLEALDGSAEGVSYVVTDVLTPPE